MQQPLFMTTSSDWRPPSLASLPSWQGAKRIGFDVETRDELLTKLGPGSGRRPNTYITGISFAIEDGPGAYLPIRHDGGDNLPLAGVLGYIRHQAKHFEGEIVGANLQYDIDFAASDGITFPKV